MNNVFQIESDDPSTLARSGWLWTRRGWVETPVFMPVGTQAAVKTLTPQEVVDTGTRLILANTYHLMLRPGAEILRNAGGVQQFMNWPGPILTDSGGYQVFSLSSRRTVREAGVQFSSHIDGRKLELTPESVIDLQIAYGSDIMMPLDELVGYETTVDEQRSAAERTQRWLGRAVAHFVETSVGDSPRPLLFGITQGGFVGELRAEHSHLTAQHKVDGYSIGGLSVGESKSELFEMLDASIAGLPLDKPRYLMGVGSPEDLWEAVARGVDMFDSVHPTRVARRGAHFTNSGRVNITAARYRDQFDPLDPSCDCYACSTFSAAYIHHLFRSDELLGPRLATIHNLYFFQRLMENIRVAVRSGDFEDRRRAFLSGYSPVNEAEAQAQRSRWMEHQARKTGAKGANHQ